MRQIIYWIFQIDFDKKNCRLCVMVIMGIVTTYPYLQNDAHEDMGVRTKNDLMVFLVLLVFFRLT